MKRAVGNSIKKEVYNSASSAVKNVGKGQSREEKFTFGTLPQNLTELKALPEAFLDSAFKAAALTLAALCRYGESTDDLNQVNLPDPVATELECLRRRIVMLENKLHQLTEIQEENQKGNEHEDL